jgi:hypothetical protein
VKIFYTYMWLREDGTPYYVGKGSGDRAFRSDSLPKDRILIQDFPSEADAFEAEKFLIAYYGRKDLKTGILINMSEGGNAPPSREGSHPEFSEEHRRKLAESNKRRKGKYSQETLRKLREAALGKVPSVETRRKMSEASKGRRHSEADLIKMSLSQKGRVLSEDHRRKLSEAAKKRKKIQNAAS